MMMMMMSPCSCSRLLLRDYCSRRRRFGVLQNIPTTTTTGISPKNDSHLSFFFVVDDDDARSKKRHTDSRRLLVGTTPEERDEADVSRCVWSSFLFSLSLSLSLEQKSRRLSQSGVCVGMCANEEILCVSRVKKKSPVSKTLNPKKGGLFFVV